MVGRTRVNEFIALKKPTMWLLNGDRANDAD